MVHTARQNNLVSTSQSSIHRCSALLTFLIALLFTWMTFLTQISVKQYKSSNQIFAL